MKNNHTILLMIFHNMNSVPSKKNISVKYTVMFCVILIYIFITPRKFKLLWKQKLSSVKVLVNIMYKTMNYH